MDIHDKIFKVGEQITEANYKFLKPGDILRIKSLAHGNETVLLKRLLKVVKFQSNWIWSKQWYKELSVNEVKYWKDEHPFWSEHSLQDMGIQLNYYNDRHTYYLGKIKLKETIAMGEYEKITERIGNLNNGWDKEADDILQKIGEGQGNWFSIHVGIINSNNYKNFKCIEIIRGWNGGVAKLFLYDTQCEKMGAFKKTLLWLLDHSDIKKDLVGEEVDTEIEGKVYRVKILRGIK